jgi:hypothetical protein
MSCRSGGVCSSGVQVSGCLDWIWALYSTLLPNECVAVLVYSRTFDAFPCSNPFMSALIKFIQ